MSVKKLALTMICMMSLYGCLKAQRSATPSPAPEGPQVANSVTLSLPSAGLSDLALTAQQIVIRVNKIDGDAIGIEAHKAYVFALTTAGLYSMEGLPLEELSFAIELQDAAGQVLAEGSVRALIKQGAQTLPAVNLKPIAPTTVGLDLQVTLNLLNFPNSAPSVPVEPAAVRTILMKYQCQACHNTTPRASAGLNLKDFPYKNIKGNTFPEILAKVLDSLTGINGVPMMPRVATPPLVKPEEVAVVKDFLQAVNDAATASDIEWVKQVQLSLGAPGPGRLDSVLTLKNGNYVLPEAIELQAGSRYPYTLTVLGPDGSKLYEVIDATFDVPLDGQVLLKIDIPYQAPAGTVPVSVTPSVN